MPVPKLDEGPKKAAEQAAPQQTSNNTASASNTTENSHSSAQLSSGPPRDIQSGLQNPTPIDASQLAQPIAPTSKAKKPEKAPLQLIAPHKQLPIFLKALKKDTSIHYGLKFSNSLNQEIARCIESQCLPSDPTGVIDEKTGVSTQFRTDYFRQTTNIETANGSFKSLTRFSLPKEGSDKRVTQEEIEDTSTHQAYDDALLKEIVRLATDLVGDSKAVAPLSCILNQTTNGSISKVIAELNPKEERVFFMQNQSTLQNVYSLSRKRNGNIEAKVETYSQISTVVLPEPSGRGDALMKNQTQVERNAPDENNFDHAVVVSMEIDRNLLLQGELKIVKCQTKYEVCATLDPAQYFE